MFFLDLVFLLDTYLKVEPCLEIRGLIFESLWVIEGASGEAPSSLSVLMVERRTTYFLSLDSITPLADVTTLTLDILAFMKPTDLSTDSSSPCSVS